METATQAALNYQLKNYIPYVAAIYICGVAINFLKLGMAWYRIRQIRQSLISAAIIQRKLEVFLPLLSVKKPVNAFFSQLVDVPCVVGYFKPVLLLPVTFTTNLSAAEAEAILLHELAHIKHNDYLLNILQQVISVVFFFNPFARMLSKMVDTERELNCDDVVVKFTGAPAVYASALIKLEETRQIELPLALAATGKKYKLFLRIERLLKPKLPAVNAKHLLFTTLLFISSIGSIAWLNPEIKNGTVVSQNGTKAIAKLSEVIKKVSNGFEGQFNPSDTVPIHHSEIIKPVVSKNNVNSNANESKYYGDKDTVYRDKSDGIYSFDNSKLYTDDDSKVYTYQNDNKYYGSNVQKYYGSTTGKYYGNKQGVYYGTASDILFRGGNDGSSQANPLFNPDKDNLRKSELRDIAANNSYSSPTNVNSKTFANSGITGANYNDIGAQSNFVSGQLDQMKRGETPDDLRRKRAGEIRDVLWNSPESKTEREAYTAEFHNSDVWKKHYASSVESLKILGDHPGPKEYGIWREVVSRDNAEMESSEAYKIYDAKLKDLSRRLDQEYRKRLAEEYPDPRSKTAF